MKIPKGWRKLKRGYEIKDGDKYWHLLEKLWMTTVMQGYQVGDHNDFTYIRKKSK